MKLRPLTGSDFVPFVSEARAAVVLFYATWENYHPALRKRVEELADHFSDRVNFGDVDVDSDPELAISVHLRNVPALGYFKDGSCVEVIVGAVAKEIIEEQINRILEAC